MGRSIKIGDDSSIDRPAVIRAFGDNLTVGATSNINPYYILYGHGELKIGNRVRIAAHTIIIPANHIKLDSLIEIHSRGQTKKVWKYMTMLGSVMVQEFQTVLQ